MGFSELFNADSIDKQVKITVDGQVFTNTDLSLEEMEIEEQLCSDKTLRFGKCEASTFKLRIISDNCRMSNKKISASVLVENKEYVLGTYKVKSDKPTADRKYKDIVAYDSMYDIIISEVSSWYNTILPDADSTVTLKQFRTSFLAYFGIEQEEVTLVNDSMIVRKTIEPSKLSGKTVITAICEINGCFGHIGRDGRFKYVFLKKMEEGLYPSDTLYPNDNLFPRDPVNAEQIKRKHYISAEYEDYVTAKINKLQIRQEEDDIGATYPLGEVAESDNCYIVQDNFLLYGMSAEELNTVAENMYSVISKVTYRPAHIEAKGNPCLEVGDGIRLATTNEIIRTYILQRTLKGIQALRDTYDAEGEQFQRQKIKSVEESIIQLKGKTNKLIRTVEETRSEIENVEKGLSSSITQTAELVMIEVNKSVELAGGIGKDLKENYSTTIQMNSAIKASAEEISLSVSKIYSTKTEVDDKLKHYSTTTEMNAAITAKADEISLSVSKTYSTKTEVSTAKTDAISTAAEDATNKANSALTSANDNTAEKLKSYSTTTQMNAAITAKADEISLAVSKVYETKSDSEEKREELSSKITLNANNITAEVKRAQAQEVELAAAISVNAENINLKVTKGNISSEISQEAGKISIKSNRFSLESTNCTISENGTISAKNVDLTGKITASSGKIGGFDIGTSSLYSGKSTLTSSLSGVYLGTDGISVGKNSAFKVTSDGNIAINGSGSLKFSGTSNKMELDCDGISFGASSYTTAITKDKVQVYDNFIDTNGLQCGESGTFNTTIKGAEVSVNYAYNRFVKIDHKDITLGSGDTHKIIHGTTDLMSLMSNAVMIYPTYSLVGKYDGYLGFFGSSTSGTCSKKKTVSTITSTSSATASTNAAKINELINALKAYNLIG